MGFFSRLLRSGPTPEDAIGPMKEIADELGRTNESRVQTYAGQLHEALGRSPDPLLYKAKFVGAVQARFLGAMHVVAAYGLSTRDAKGGSDLMEAAGGLAVEPLLGLGVSFPGSHVLMSEEFELEVAKEALSEYAKGLGSALGAALLKVPILPDADFPELIRLAEKLHQALANSIGDEYYSPQVREFFDHSVRGTVAMTLNHVAQIKF